MPYTDSTGQPWPISIDLPAARRARDLVGVNLLTLDLPGLLERLADPVTLCQVLWAIAKPDADAAGLDMDGFLRRITIDLTGLTDQLLGELAGFFRRLGQTEKAETLTRIWRTAKTIPTTTEAETEAAILDAETWIRKRYSGTAATPSPASWESTPTSQA